MRPGVGERVYRLMLRAYPADFRRHCEDELLEHFRRDRVRRRYAGAAGAARFWCHIVADWARTMWSEHRDAPGTAAVNLADWRTWPRGTPGFRHAARSLRRDRSFSIVAVITLSVGMCATTLVFSIVNGALLTPLPLPRPDRLVQVEERQHDNPDARMAAYGNWLDLAALEVFDQLATFAYDTKTLTGVDSAQRLRSREVSANFFDALEVTPLLGRTFAAEETVDGQHRVVALAHGVWSETFGADPDILGKSVQLDAKAFTVVGVMGPGFDFPFAADIWIPLRPSSADCMRRCHRYRMTGRLADGVGLSQAQEALDVAGRRLRQAFPENSEHDYFAAYPLLDEYVGEARPALRLLSIAVGLVLLVACVNIASLSLARSAARRHEIAMRRALGASRLQLAGLVVTEGIVLGAVAGAVGLVCTLGAVRLLLALAADTIPRAETVFINSSVLLFAALVATASGLLVSLFPLLAEARTRAARASSTHTAAAPRTVWARHGLVVGQLAMAVVLVTGAALLGRSLRQLTAVHIGVVADGVLTLNIALPNGKYEDGAAEARFFAAALPGIESIVGVDRAAAVLTLPANPFGWRNSFTVRSNPLPENEIPSISYVVASPGYFATLSIPVLSGRGFRHSDDGTEPVAVINHTAAETFFPAGDALGALVLGDPRNPETRWARIVGVVEDVRQDLREAPLPEVYVPVAQDRVLSYVLVVKATVTTESQTAAIRDALAAIDPDVPVTRVMHLDDRFRARTGDARFNAGLMSTFALVALALAAIGVYGVLSYSVSLRRREFGVRTAIGASRLRVIGMVLREASLIGALAVTAGVAGALALGRLLAGLLFEVGSSDPTTLASVSLVVAAVTIVAALLPAWRAASTDPLSALRGD